MLILFRSLTVSVRASISISIWCWEQQELCVVGIQSVGVCASVCLKGGLHRDDVFSLLPRLLLHSVLVRPLPSAQVSFTPLEE